MTLEYDDTAPDLMACKPILECLSYALSVWSSDARLIYYNHAYLDFFFDGKDVLRLGMGLPEVHAIYAQQGFCGPDEAAARAERTFAHFKTCAETQKDVIFDQPVHSGTVQTRIKTLPNGGWFVTYDDITIALERSNALERQNMLFSLAINNMSQGLSLFNAQKQLVICNERYAQIYKLPDALRQPGTSFWDIIEHCVSDGMVSVDTIAGREEQFNEIIEAKKAANGVEEMLNGTVMSISHQPLSDGGWLAVHEDITERRQKEALIEQRTAEVERQNMRFLAAVNNMPHGMIVFDREKRLVICNEPYIQFYNLPPHLSKPGTDFVDIYTYRSVRGMVRQLNNGDIAATVAKPWIPGDKASSVVEFLDGRVIHMNHQVTADGGRISIHQDITQQHRSREMIEHLARHDGLTGLPNRTSFLDAMAEAERKIAAGESMAVMCIDLNNFKPINDNMGHAAGDAVLKITAERIAAIIANHGTAARLGGDEFAVIIGPIKNQAVVAKIAQDISAALCEVMRVDGFEVSLSASIGVVLGPKDGTTTEALMRNCDLALYRAKNDTGSAYCFFEAEMRERHVRRRAIEAGLRDALACDGLELHYQPLLNLEKDEIHCCEALMRWHDPNMGNISPAEFIPIAEETGLIREMGNWALHRACETAARWPEHVRIAVNVSPVQFKGNELVERVVATLDETGLAAERLELEITESLFLADNDHNLSILHSLHSLGVRIALDDFGTGYSSLSYLRSFPFDKIKIDRSFIAELSEKSETDAIITAVLQLGASFGMTTTAEGVETQAQLDFVKAQGCTEIQGYLFSKPLNEAQIDGRLQPLKNAVQAKTGS